MIGAIAGCIIGSVFEHDPIKTTTFPVFSQSSRCTDDTVLSVAIAGAIIMMITTQLYPRG
jgi:ADP-ribosylglycohydrolase